MNERDRGSSTRYREIYDRVRSAIADGRLRAGDRVPSCRALAAELNVARGTVGTAYELLTGEGFLVAQGRSGTIVSPTLPASWTGPRRANPARTLVADPEDFTQFFATPLSLLPGLPSFDLFPRTLWARLVSRQLRSGGMGGFSYPDAMGVLALREALVSYLGVARGIRCTPDQVIITGGYLSAFGLICWIMLQPGAEVWLETPGYNFTRRAVTTVGAVPVSVAVDHEGLDVEFGIRASPNARLCVVAPSNQFPLGVSLSLNRRLALLDWADRTGGWIVEDDYAGEFRYDGWPLPALKSLDEHERVFYIGTFSKTMFPGLRLGYLVVPAAHLSHVRHAVRRMDGGRPALEQTALAAFLADGHFGRHIKRMRSAYRSRKQALAAALNDTFGERFPIQPTVGGLNLVAAVQPDEVDTELEARAIAAGMMPLALSRFGHDGLQPRGLLLGFSNLPEAHAQAAIHRLSVALQRR